MRPDSPAERDLPSPICFDPAKFVSLESAEMIPGPHRRSFSVLLAPGADSRTWEMIGTRPSPWETDRDDLLLAIVHAARETR
jgi:hypothetical protein